MNILRTDIVGKLKQSIHYLHYTHTVYSIHNMWVYDYSGEQNAKY